MSELQVRGLRILADIIEREPRIGEALAYPLNTLTTYGATIDAEDGTKMSEKESLRFIIDAFKGLGFQIKKDYSSSSFRLQFTMEEPVYTYERFGIEFVLDREAVCTPRKVGEKTVTRKIMPPSETWAEKTETVDVVEWDCSPILATDDDTPPSDG